MWVLAVNYEYKEIRIIKLSDVRAVLPSINELRFQLPEESFVPDPLFNAPMIGNNTGAVHTQKSLLPCQTYAKSVSLDLKLHIFAPISFICKEKYLF